MKKLVLIFGMILFTFSMNAQKKGEAYILPMGNGVYQSSITGRSGFIGTGKLKTKALAKGKEFAKEKKAQIEIIGFDTVEQSFMVFPQAIMTFRLVYETVEINDPNDPNTITIKTTGNYKNNNQETTITKPSTQIQNKDQKDAAMIEVKRLKELLDLGIITQDEFDVKIVSLKKILLDN